MLSSCTDVFLVQGTRITSLRTLGTALRSPESREMAVPPMPRLWQQAFGLLEDPFLPVRQGGALVVGMLGGIAANADRETIGAGKPLGR